MTLPSAFRRLVLSFSVVAPLAACDGDVVPVGGLDEQLTLPEQGNYLHALVRDGNFVYAASETRLDRIDDRTGEVTTVAGSEYAVCPKSGADTDNGLGFTFSRRPFVVRGTTAYLANSCGFWTYDFESHRAQLVVDGGDPHFYWDHPERLWNGKPGPDLKDGMSLAADVDGLIGCFTVWGPSQTVLTEIWTLDRDGMPGERLASVPNKNYGYCRDVVVDSSSIVFATDDTIYRLDRAARAVTSIVNDEGKPEGLASDAFHVYWVDDNGGDVMRIANDGTDRSRVFTAQFTASLTFAALDGDWLWVRDGLTLKRVPKDGGLAFDFTPQSSRDGHPLDVPIVFTAEHVYFGWFTRAEVRPRYSVHRAKK